MLSNYLFNSIKSNYEIGPSISSLTTPPLPSSVKVAAWMKVAHIHSGSLEFVKAYLVKFDTRKVSAWNRQSENFELYWNTQKIGSLILKIEKEQVLIEQVENLAKSRFKYVGTALCEFAYELSRKGGLEGCVRLVTGEDNEGFYKRLGYERSPDAKPNPNATEFLVHLSAEALNIKRKEYPLSAWILFQDNAAQT